MIAFRLDFPPDEIDTLSGCTYGHLTVEADGARATSEERTPSQAMMLFLTVPLLLDGLRKFLPNKRERAFVLSAVGSSFPLAFTREAGNRLHVTSGQVDLGSWPARDVGEAVWRGVKEFMDTYFDALAMNDLAHDDLDASVVEFQAAFVL